MPTCPCAWMSWELAWPVKLHGLRLLPGHALLAVHSEEGQSLLLHSWLVMKSYFIPRTVLCLPMWHWHDLVLAGHVAKLLLLRPPPTFFFLIRFLTQFKSLSVVSTCGCTPPHRMLLLDLSAEDGEMAAKTAYLGGSSASHQARGEEMSRLPAQSLGCFLC